MIVRHGAKGMCHHHYKRLRSWIPLDRPKQGTFVRKCSYERCDRKHYGGGLCQTHYWRSKSIGGLEGSTRIPRPFIESDDHSHLLVPLGVNAKQGYSIVDTEFKSLERYKWSLGTRGYAVANVNGKTKYLHHLILGPMGSLVVNHKDENKLNNRRVNLEIVDRRANNTFKSTHPKGKTGVRGVYLDSRPLSKPYKAQIQWGSAKRKKYFATIDEAIAPRKQWEVELFGRTAP